MRTSLLTIPIRLRRTGVGLIALCVVLAGCGGGDDDAAEDPAAAADTSTPADSVDGSESANGDDAGADDAATDPGGADDAATDPGGTDDTAATDTDGADEPDEEVAEGTAQVLVQFRGQQIVVSAADPDFSCVAMGGTEMVAFGILDDAGNDISVAYEGDSVNATATLADGSNWNQTEGGVLNVVEGPDGAIRMSIQLTETTTGESEPMDVRLTC